MSLIIGGSNDFSAGNRSLSWSIAKKDKYYGSVDKMQGSGQSTDTFFDPSNPISLSNIYISMNWYYVKYIYQFDKFIYNHKLDQ